MNKKNKFANAKHSITEKNIAVAKKWSQGKFSSTEATKKLNLYPGGTFYSIMARALREANTKQYAKNNLY